MAFLTTDPGFFEGNFLLTGRSFFPYNFFIMKPLLHAHLLNEPFGDPALYVEILWEHRALLFDLGDLGNLRPAKMLKISHAFVTHTHIDHFIGFDALLRVMLNREKKLKLFGPPGFLTNVQGKLGGYTWNLSADYPFSIEASEVYPDKVQTQLFHCHERFAPGAKWEKPFCGRIVEDPQLQVQAEHLDHLIPSLAFALQERIHVNVHKERVAEMGLPIGPWLKELKEAIWKNEQEEKSFVIPTTEKENSPQKEVSFKALKDLVTISPGQKIAYVADCRFTRENIDKIVRLAERADLFFCEAAFLEKDRQKAEEKAHLTARQAGELARKAKAKKLCIFHFSPKYEREMDLLHQEAEEAFLG